MQRLEPSPAFLLGTLSCLDHTHLLQVPLQLAVAVVDVARVVDVVDVARVVDVAEAATTATAHPAGSLTGMMALAGGEHTV